MAYVLLALSIFSETFGSTMLKMSDAFSNLLPSIGVVIGYLSSFTFLGFALKTLPLSGAYAVWSGVGTALTAIVGVMLFNEGMSFAKVLALVFIIGGVVILNKSNDYSPQKSEKVSMEGEGM
jgi:multidrug transporter EmrE-like cation transporter